MLRWQAMALKYAGVRRLFVFLNIFFLGGYLLNRSIYHCMIEAYCKGLDSDVMIGCCMLDNVRVWSEI